MVRRVPLFPLAAGLIAGILADRDHPLPPFVYLIAIACVTALLLWRSIGAHAAALALALMAASAGGLLHWSAARCVPADGIERQATCDGPFVRVRGRIIGEPRVLPPPSNPFAQWVPQSQRTSLTLAVESIQSESGFMPATGRVRVTAYETVAGLRAFETCEVFGRLYPLTPPANPGGFDWASYSRGQGICARMVCQHRENVRSLGGGRTGALSVFRAAVVGLLSGDAPAEGEEESGLLESLLLGQRSRVSPRMNEIFLRSGCLHYLSVSGIHVVIVLYLARLACRVFAAGRMMTTWVMMLAVILYACIAEPNPPIARATIIGVVYCVARLLGRERAYLNWTSAAAVILLLLNPLSIMDVGFQLSFAAVLGVAYLTPAIHGITGRIVQQGRLVVASLRRDSAAGQDREIRARLDAPGGRARNRFRRLGRWTWRQIKDGLAVSLAASVASVPIVAAHFFRVQPWAPLTSTLLMIPVTITMAVGILKMAASAISPSLGRFLGILLDQVERSLVSATSYFAELPGAMLVAPPMPIWLVIGFYAVLLLAALRFAAQPNPEPNADARIIPRRKPLLTLPRFTARGSFGIFLLGAGLTSLSTPRDRDLRITFLSVGRGSATVIELPGGRTLLYDAGASYSSDPGRGVIIPFLLSHGIDRLDRVILSHANLDHFSGLPTVITDIETGPVVLNPYFESTSGERSPSRHLLQLLTGVDHPIQLLEPAPTKWELDGAIFELLWPGDLQTKMSANDTSNVLRITFEGHSVLLTGDIDQESQEALLAQGDISADVLVLPHHGSVRRTTWSFIRAVDADVLIRSSDERMEDTINGLAEITRGIALYNTADHGAITVTINADGVRVDTMFDP